MLPTAKDPLEPYSASLSPLERNQGTAERREEKGGRVSWFSEITVEDWWWLAAWLRRCEETKRGRRGWAAWGDFESLATVGSGVGR